MFASNLLTFALLVAVLLTCGLSTDTTLCRTACHANKKDARKPCTRSKFVRNRCHVRRCKLGSGRRGWHCRPIPSMPKNPPPPPRPAPRGCRNRCYAARLSAARDCRYKSAPIEGCEIMSCELARRPGRPAWKCAPASPSFDLDKDGDFDNDDLTLLLRSIADPLGVVAPGGTVGDVNEDGKVDFDDALIILKALIEANGAASVAPLTADYNDAHTFDWDQTPLPLPTTRTAKSPRVSLKQTLETVSRADSCGVASVGDFVKGTGPKPTISWDNGYVFDPNAKATVSDYWNWAKYGTLLQGAKLLLPDAATAYARYRANTGAELTVDYEDAISDDAAIKDSVDAEIMALKNAVKEMHDGEEASFFFHSSSARLTKYPVTENWQKALGGHNIWSIGKVTYSKSPCQLTVTITLKMEDLYNFNRGQLDIATGLPDDDNGRFEVLGWAKSFFSRGEITRVETIPLECCEDSDCGNPTQFECECNECTTQCPTQQRSGGQGFTTFAVDLKKTQGTFTGSYQMYSIPDELTIKYEGAVVFSTGGLVSGSRSFQVTYGSATSTSTAVTVELNAPRSGTAWVISITCPP